MLRHQEIGEDGWYLMVNASILFDVVELIR
jgi:hypothetical protein